MIDRYRRASDLPSVLPLFPLRGVILLPRATLPLNVFEPRYLALLDDALAKDRLIGVVQPSQPAEEGQSPYGKSFSLRSIGCVGRVTAFDESEDGRTAISLTGISRFTLQDEVPGDDPFRRFSVDYGAFAHDLLRGDGEEDVDRTALLDALRAYLDANGLSADWDSIERSSNERLVNALSMLSPYGPEEKQALLEAPDLKARAEALVALAAMDMAARDDETGSTIQ